MGVVLYILLSGRMPFAGETNEDIINEIMKGQYNFDFEIFDGISPCAKSLIQSLLVINVDERLSATGAYNHPFI